MGVVFFLGFVLAIVSIGAVIAFTGILILVLRSVRKRKTEKRYRVAKVAGIICLAAGGLIVVVPLAVVALIVVAGVGMNVLEALEEAYFDKYVKTDTVIEVSEEKIDSDGFDYKDGHYIPVNCFYVAYRDKNRKEAVANLKDGKWTVFAYKNPSGCRMLSIRDGIYCREDDTEKLKEYYRSGQFKYVCEYSDKEELHEFKVTFPDELFWELCEPDTNKKKLVSKDWSQYDLKSRYMFEIVQKRTEDHMFRSLSVTVSTDGDVYVDLVEPLAGNEEYMDYLYLVTDESAADKLLEIGKKTEGSGEY